MISANHRSAGVSPACDARSRRDAGAALSRACTLVELLVVTAISVMLMTVLAFIYANSLKLYQESQGMQEIYETAKILNRDLRDALNNVVPVPGAWIKPVTIKFP